MSIQWQTLFCIALLMLLFSCAPSRYVKPLKQKQQAASFSFGGPLIVFSGAPIPIPFTTVGYAYGLSNRISLYGNLHLTSAAFRTIQTDIGGTIALCENKKGGFSVSPALQSVFSMAKSKTFKIWPSVDFNGFVHLGQRGNYIYGGLGNWIETSAWKAHGEKTSEFIVPSLHAGFVSVKNHWQHQFQLGWLAPGSNNKPNVVQYIGAGNKGALSFHYGLVFVF